jgi:hypothetical protein
MVGKLSQFALRIIGFRPSVNCFAPQAKPHPTQNVYPKLYLAKINIQNLSRLTKTEPFVNFLFRIRALMAPPNRASRRQLKWKSNVGKSLDDVDWRFA